jgi:4-amino-4-deoxy-L-arabinose transferase-like glycosyltransferase
VLAIVTGTAARIVVAVHHQGFDVGDQVPYSILATSLADHLRYAIPRAQDTFHWAPGAPALFAVGLRAFGRGDSQLAGAYIVQALSSIGTLGLLYLVCRRLASPRAALIACAGLAVSTGAITAGGDLITEPAGAALLLAAAGLIALGMGHEDQRPPSLRWFGAGGLVLGISVLVRPDFLVLTPVCVAVVLLAWRPAMLQRRLLAATTLVAACAVIVTPWCIWASSQAGQLVLPTTSGGSSFWVGTFLPADGQTPRARVLLAADVHVRFPDTYNDPLPLATDMMRTVAARRPTLAKDVAIREETQINLHRYAIGHPAAFTRMELRKVGRMWSRPYQGHNRHRSWWGQLLHVPAIVAALATLGAAVTFGRRRPALILLAALIVAGTVFNSLAAVQPRSNVRFLPVAFLGAGIVLAGRPPGDRRV